MPRKATKSSNSNVQRSFSEELEEMRLACEADICTFVKIVQPHRVLGDVHYKALRRMANRDKHHKLWLAPRDHQKSYCAAVYVAWSIARDPTVTFLYISATATLAEKQLYLIKGILESEFFKLLWPDMINEKINDRDRWTNYEINVDHPARKAAGVRDATITTGGVGKTITGLHPREIIGDDVVAPDNAYTEIGRESVSAYCSQLASIESADGYSLWVGTRYHPRDIYNDFIEMEREVYNQFGDMIGTEKVFDVAVDVVEKNGVFLWPKVKAADGKEYGFDHNLLALKKARYTDKPQFFAQYYNDPNRGVGKGIESTYFQYYEDKWFKRIDGKWYCRDKRINLYAAMDFAFSLQKTADYTAIVIIGMDEDRTVYVLDIDRFRTQDVNEYIKHIVQLQSKWGFSKMSCEVTVAQDMLVNHVKDALWTNGAMISIDKIRPIKDKKDRINDVLNPFYKNYAIWHGRGGLFNKLEEELIMEFPEHDDIKDALASACENITQPARSGYKAKNLTQSTQMITRHPVFGGVVRRRAM